MNQPLRPSFAPATTHVAAPIAFEQFTEPNGLTVILHEDHKAPIVHVLVWYHVGSKDETLDRTGFAHLFEHMMFQGSENVGKTEHFTYVQGVGGTLNATTGSWWEIPVTLTQSLVFLGLVLVAARRQGLETRTGAPDFVRAGTSV